MNYKRNKLNIFGIMSILFFSMGAIGINISDLDTITGTDS